MDCEAKDRDIVHVRYMDRDEGGSFDFRRNFLIYTENPESVFSIEFGFSDQWKNDRLERVKINCKNISTSHADDQNPVKEIEREMINYCRSRGMNAIKASSMSAFPRIVERHLKDFYGVGTDSEYFLEIQKPKP
jgi:hypothetical protein